MPHTNPPDDRLRAILTEATTIAVVGASSNPERTSHGVMQYLIDAGYRVIPVNPKETEVLGQTAYPTLAAVAAAGMKVDIVDVFRKSEDTPGIADEAAAIGAKVLWLQLGIASDDAAARATSKGLTVIMDACIRATHKHLVKR